MNNKKVLSAAILLILAKSAGAIEVEPNEDSNHANPLSLDALDLVYKNVGQLNKGSDVDFFKVTNSCFKYTDKTTEHAKGSCVKYKATGEKYTLSEEKNLTTPTLVYYSYPSDISVSFTCNNRALQKGQDTIGWYLGIHDTMGVLQDTYQIKPEECTIGATAAKGPYSIKFPMILPTGAIAQKDSYSFLLASTETLPANASDYVSIVGDCHIPVYNTNPADHNVTVNDVVKATPATQAEIAATSTEIAAGKAALAQTKADLASANFVLIGANAQIADITDTLALTTDIVKSAISNLTPETTVNAATSAATAAKVSSWAISYWVGTHTIYLEAKEAANDPAIQAAIDTAENNVTKAETAVKNATDAVPLSKAVFDAQATLTTAKNTLTTAKTDLTTANTTLVTAKNDLTTANGTQTTKNEALTTANNKRDTAQKTLDTATTDLKNAKDATPPVPADVKTTQDAVDKAQSAYDNALAAATTAQSAFDTAKTAATTAQDAFNTAKTAVTTAQDAVTKAQDAVTKAQDAVTAAQAANPQNATYTIAQAALTAAQTAKDAADLTKKTAENAKKALDTTLANATKVDETALTRVGEAYAALTRAVKVLNDAVNADIKATQASTGTDSRSNNSCAFSNTATYTLESNKPSNQPYEDIVDKKPLLSLSDTNNSRIGQISSFLDVDFYKVDGLYNYEYKDDLPQLQFSCTKNSTNGSAYGWYVSVWKHSVGGDTRQSGFEIVPTDCLGNTPYSIISPKTDDDTEDKKTDSYYVAVQTACASFPVSPASTLDYRTEFEGSNFRLECNVNTTNYTLKFNGTPKSPLSPADQKAQLKAELDAAIPLGNEKTGSFSAVKKVDTTTLKETLISDNYVIDSNGSADIPLMFTCSSMAMRKTNDWKVSVYDSNYTLIPTLSSIFINGSDCGSGFVNDKGGYSFTLPKGFARYYVSVKPVSKPCPTPTEPNAECVVDSTEYSITRDVTKVRTGKYVAKKGGFKLTSCGVNSQSVISATLSTEMLKNIPEVTDKTPIKIQIGNMACQVLTSNVEPAANDVGRIIGAAKMIDSRLIGQDSGTLTLGECGDTNSKITLTETRLDFADFNPAPVVAAASSTTPPATTVVATPVNSESVVIPVKVSIGDFNCEGQGAFFIHSDKPKVGDKTYTNVTPPPCSGAACPTKPVTPFFTGTK